MGCGIGSGPLATGRVLPTDWNIIVAIFFFFFLLDQIDVG